MKTIKTLLWRASVGIVALLFLVIIGVHIVVFSRDSITYTTVDSVPTTTVTVVLGGGMTSPGMMSEMQADRVLQAVALYRAGKTERIIMSGDDGALRNDEVTFMKQLAIDEGVPASDIDIDPHAYRTYLTCYRAKHEFRLDRMVVITQSFHLPRTLYLCNALGIDTIGLSSDLKPYSHLWKAYVREVFARVKAVLEVEVVKPEK
jgi:vancomycin permeability regulator SanA